MEIFRRMKKKYITVAGNERLLKEWDWEENRKEGLDPNVLTCGSNKTAHWICSVCGHKYTTRISRKNNGSLCKKCLARSYSIAPKEKSLAVLYPKLAKEWSEKNLVLPDSVYPQSNIEYWWVCPNGHDDYKTKASDRINKKSGCPICSNHKVVPGINDLASQYPDLMKEWDWEKNDAKGLDPTKLSYGNDASAYWRCQKGHSWSAVIYSRTSGHCGCPKCSKELRTSYPEKIVAFYISKLFEEAKENYRGKELNKSELDIYIPSLKVGIEYDGSRWHKKLEKDLLKDELCDKLGIFLIRVREKGCANYESTSLKYYVVEKSEEELANAMQAIIKLINRKYGLSLKCDIDIKRDSSIILSNVLSKAKENSVVNSNFADEWDYVKNKNVNPQYVSKHSNKRYWWICNEYKHSWYALACDRAKGNGCPYCSGQRVLKGFNDLESQYPDLAKEWDYETNKIKPDEVTAKSNKPYHWICAKCNHHWKTRVYVRTALGCGCPECMKISISQKIVANAVKKAGSLKMTNPELAKEFHPTKNGNITPDAITANHNGNVVWKCSVCGFEWSASPSSRNQGARCPHCSGRVPMTGVDDLLTVFPEICKEWDYSKNTILPSEVTPGSGKKVYWKCSTCGYSWKTEVAVRALGNCGCRKCGHIKTGKASRKEIKNTDTGVIFESVGIAADAYGILRNSISNCLTGRSKTAGGYHWEYVDNN